MKTRNGFVSNSSSSSFVIAVKESVPCKHCGRKDPDILDLLDNSHYTHSDCNYVDEWGIDGIMNDYNCIYEPQSDEEKNAEEKMKLELEKYVKDGYRVASIRISHHDEQMNEIFRQCEKNGTIVVLSRDY